MGRRHNSFTGRISVVSLAQQGLQIRRGFPNFYYTWGDGGAIWRGTLQPRAASPTYKVVVRYKLREVPAVRVTWPKLAPNAPHLWSNGTLCLFWHKEWRWRQDQVIAETILPWAALWLYYYELWLDTGEWLGPSSHSPCVKRDEDRHAA